MQPAVARKFIETFSDAVSVQIFAQTELIETGDELDTINVDDFFERYKQWPPRARMSGAKFIEFLKVTCKLDVVDDDPVEDYPAMIVGVQLKKTAKTTVKAKARNQTKPPPEMVALQRAAKLPTLTASARALNISPRALRGLCKRNPKVAALFTRQ